MGPGEENSGKLVSQVRKKAKELAAENSANIILTDGPPGTGCPAIASITGTDLVVLVLEPTKSSLHDAERVVDLVEQFKIPMVAIINKFDLHKEVSDQIEDFLAEHSITLLDKIPFDETMVRALVNGQSIVEYNPGSEIAKSVFSVWNKIIHSTRNQV